MIRVKKIWLILISVIPFVTYGQDYTISFGKKSNGIEVLQNNVDNLTLTINFAGIDALHINTAKGDYTQLALEGSYRTGQPGEPQLPSIKKLIEVPAGALCSVKIVNYEKTDFLLSNYGLENKVIPFQPSYPKSIDPDKVEFILNNEAYKIDEFNESEIATIESVGRLRGIDLAKVTINPVRYNPVKNEIRVYNNITIEVEFENGSKILTNNWDKRTASPYFDAVYSTIINHNSKSKDNYTDNPDHTKYPVSYLVVTAPEFETQLASFVDWKTKKGFKVNLVTTTQIGSTASSIKTWVQSQYDASTETNPAPTFLLLVGDVAQVPASQTGTDSEKATDLYYCTMDGSSDIIPDIYYGRLSAQNATQLQSQIDKILYYEKYQFDDDTYLNKTTLIAGADATWNPRVLQPTIKYGTENYFNVAHGFTTVNAYLNSYTDCYTADKIKVSFINYTAHCSETSWGGPSLTQSMVNAFTNQNQYPLAIGNCCLAADFGTSECMGETWMRKANGGSVAYIGSSPSSYWYEDFYWAVGAHNYVANQYPTFDQSTLGAYDAPFVSDYICVDALVFVGDLAVTEAHDLDYPSQISTRYYWEAYNCLSDPSLFIYLTQGENNTVSHQANFPIGASTFSISAIPGSYAAISKDGVLLGTALIPSGGVASIAVTPVVSTGNVDIVVTKSQYKPYITSIPAVAQSGPYLLLTSFTVDDSSGNGMVEINEPFNINFSVKNIGTISSEGVTASITTNDRFIQSSADNLNISLPNVGVSQIITVYNHFDFVAADSVDDQHEVVFNITFNDNFSSAKRSYQFQRSILINAPILNLLAGLNVNDLSENNNGILDPGETATLDLALSNIGHAQISPTVNLSIISGSEYLTLLSNTGYPGVININTNKTAEFTVQAGNNTPSGTQVQIKAKAFVGNNNYANEQTYDLTIGLIPEAIIGTGTIVAENYPLNNYYENNKTQMLFFANELGGSPKVIKDLAFQISYGTYDVNKRDLHNFKIRIMPTTLSALTTFVDLSTVQPVYEQSVYNLTGNTGWEVFNFPTGFAFDGNSNLIIEVVWGDNGEYSLVSERTKVYCTPTSVATVAYGYDDSQTPPVFRATSTNRPNILMHVQNTYNLTFVVLDDENRPVNEAVVSIGTTQEITNPDGIARFVYPAVQSGINYEISATGFQNLSGIIDLNSNSVIDTIYLTPLAKYTVNFLVNNSNGALDGAKVEFNNQIQLSNNLGVCSFTNVIEGDNYAYNITMDGYSAQSGVININSNQNLTITLDEIILNPEIISVENLRGGKAKLIWLATASGSAGKPIEYYTIYLNGVEIADSVEVQEFTFSNLTVGQTYTAGLKSNYQTGESEIVTSEFTYSQIFAINFLVTINNIAQNNVPVFFNSETLYTNSDGIALFNVSMSTDTIVYYVNITGYYQQSGFVIPKLDTTIQIELKFIPDITFEVIDQEGQFIEGAKVSFNNLYYLTNNEGKVIFCDVLRGEYQIYEVSFDGYLSVTDSLSVLNDNLIQQVVLLELPEITFNIFDIDNQSIIGAVVEFNDLIRVTGSEGKVVFNNVNPVKNKPYKVTCETYLPKYDTIDVTLENSSLNVTLYSLPDVRFVISDGLNHISGATIKLNNISVKTDLNGEALFKDVSPGPYNFSISNSGFYPIEGNINVINTDLTEKIALKFIPDVTFTVLDGDSPIENVGVKLNSKELFTNINGQSLFVDQVQGKYKYDVEFEGYYSVSDSLEVEEDNIEKIIKLNKIPDLTFIVTDGSKPLSNAIVKIGDKTELTNDEGKAVFIDIIAGEYNFCISHDLFDMYCQNIIVSDLDMEESVVMKLSSYKVTFNIVEGNNPIADARISLGELATISDINGNAVFENILPADDINYTVEKDGYFAINGELDVESVDVTKLIELVREKFSVTFVVFDVNGLLSGALVSFNNEQHISDSEGKAIFENVIPNVNMAYSVSKNETHINAEGVVSVDSDEVVPVVLTLLGAKNNHEFDLVIFPNPSHGIFSLRVFNAINGFSIQVFDQTGRAIVYKESLKDYYSIDLSDLEKGIYFIKTTVSNNSTIKKVIIN